MTNALVKSYGPTVAQDGMAVQQPVIQLQPVVLTDLWSQALYGGQIYSAGLDEYLTPSAQPSLGASVTFTTASGRVGEATFVSSSVDGTTLLLTMRVTVTGTTQLSGVALGNGCWLVDPGAPATPGYWTTRHVIRCVFLPPDYSYLPPEIQAAILAGTIALPPVGDGGAGSPYVCSLQPIEFYVEPQPARAPVEACPPTPPPPDFNFGWNAGARSVQQIARGARIQWTVGSTMVGAIVGFEDMLDGAPVGATWQPQAASPQPINDVSFANTYLRGRVTLANRAMHVFKDDGSAYASTYAPGDVIALERRKTSLRVFKNGVQQGGDHALVSSRPTHMTAMLYAGGDFIDAPSITSIAEGGAALNLAPLQLVAGEGTQDAASGPTIGTLPAGSDALVPGGWALPGTAPNGEALAALLSGMSVLLPLVAEGGEFPNKMVLRALEISAWQTHQAGAALQLRPLALAASAGYAGPEPSYAVAGLYLLPLQAFGVGAALATGSAELSLRELAALGTDRVYGAAAVELAPLQLFGFSEAANEATIGTYLVSASTLAGEPLIVVSMYSDGTVASVLAVQLTLDASAASALGASTTLDSTELLHAALSSIMSIGAAVPIFEQPVQSWVLNTANLASSSYEGFEFNSFGRFAGRYVGARSDGLYLLEGDDDAGLPIRASMSLGKQNFGTTLLKRPEYAYIGVAASGDVFVKVIDPQGDSWLYRARRTSEAMQTQRADFGRGLRASYFEFEIYNADGGDIDLNTVEFRLAELSRRI